LLLAFIASNTSGPTDFAAFFSIFAMIKYAAKSVGPLVFEAINANSNLDDRHVFLFLLGEFVAALLILYFFVDYRQGMVDSGRLIVSKNPSGESNEEGPKISE
jgi:MFS-type transporter involved in bile tolerance (Atg22 family)